MLSVNFLVERQKMLSQLSVKVFALLLIALGSLCSPTTVNAETQSSQGKISGEEFVDKFPYETSRLTFICSRDAKGKVRAPFLEAGTNYSHEFIVQEYFRTDRQLPEANLAKWGEIKGAGVRVIIDVRSLDGKVAISSLFGLGADADAKKITGTISIQVMGLGGRVVTDAMAVPINLSPESIANALKTIQTLKSGIFEAADKEINRPSTTVTIPPSTTVKVPEIHIIPSLIGSPNLIDNCQKLE